VTPFSLGLFTKSDSIRGNAISSLRDALMGCCLSSLYEMPSPLYEVSSLDGMRLSSLYEMPSLYEVPSLDGLCLSSLYKMSSSLYEPELSVMLYGNINILNKEDLEIWLRKIVKIPFVHVKKNLHVGYAHIHFPSHENASNFFYTYQNATLDGPKGDEDIKIRESYYFGKLKRKVIYVKADKSITTTKKAEKEPYNNNEAENQEESYNNNETINQEELRNNNDKTEDEPDYTNNKKRKLVNLNYSVCTVSGYVTQ
ncbi:11226_t:CDS:2, partial [Ambispora leptoticha]